MIHTYQFRCYLPKSQADALNMESARIYNDVLVEHWRIYRKTGVWLRKFTAAKLNDFYDRDTPKLLHSNSIDAAQHAFHKACTTARSQRVNGTGEARYPRQRRRYRTTVFGWPTVYRVEDGILWLSLAKGLERLPVRLPDGLGNIDKKQIKEVRLVYNRATRHYTWHMVIDDMQIPPKVNTGKVAAIDMGEIHPVAITDGVDACVVSCRELRSVNRLRNKRLAHFSRMLGDKSRDGIHKRGSRRHKIMRSKRTRFLYHMQETRRDMCHKVARETIRWAQEHEIETIVIGNVRDIGDGKRLARLTQQKVSQWSHGVIRRYINEKAAEAGIEVIDNVPERYTSQTCPECGNRHKPKGRNYRCPNCGGEFHRDIVGAANIGSVYEYGEPGHWDAPEPKYRYPVLRGKRRPQATGQVAREVGENHTSLGNSA